jgi:hypothetical protein
MVGGLTIPPGYVVGQAFVLPHGGQLLLTSTAHQNPNQIPVRVYPLGTSLDFERRIRIDPGCSDLRRVGERDVQLRARRVKVRRLECFDRIHDERFEYAVEDLRPWRFIVVAHGRPGGGWYEDMFLVVIDSLGRGPMTPIRPGGAPVS